MASWRWPSPSLSAPPIGSGAEGPLVAVLAISAMERLIVGSVSLVSGSIRPAPNFLPCQFQLDFADATY